MWQATKEYLGVVGLIIVTVVILSLLSGAIYYFSKPFQAMVDNKTFKESAQYNDGMIRDLQALQMEYTKGNNEQKVAMKAIVIHRFSVYPEDKLPNDLRAFYNSIK